MQSVNSDRVENIFQKFREVVINNNAFEDPSTQEKEFIGTAIEVMLMTEPLNNNSPFSVERQGNVETALRNIDGTEFNIQSFAVTPFEHRYELEFYALSPENRYVYEFSGKICNFLEPLVVEKAILRERREGEKLEPN